MGACVIHVIFLLFYARIKKNCIVSFVTGLHSGKALFITLPSFLMVALYIVIVSYPQNLNTQKNPETHLTKIEVRSFVFS